MNTENKSTLRRLGEKQAHWDYQLALAGNPNTGKSTVFNALTGLRQHTGNWPGKTVTRAEGFFKYESKYYRLIDLPGTYSLLSASLDEEIARDFILFGRPDCVIIVVDATCLERNLNLALQVLEITGRAVVALNLMDEARRKGILVNAETLSADMGVPVVPLSARTKEGIPCLLRTLAQVVTGKISSHPHRATKSGAFRKALDTLVPMIEEMYPGLPNAEWIAIRLLDGDERIRRAVREGELKGLME